MKSISLKSIKNQSGASTVEYLLVLIVVVALGQAVYQLNDSFRDWAQNYYVAYFQCLLETGEVPSLGGEVDQGICSEEYQAFTFAAGRPPRPDQGDGGSSRGDGNRGRGEGDRGEGSPYVSSRSAGEGSDNENTIAVGGSGGRGQSSRFRRSSGGEFGESGRGASQSDNSKIYTGSTDATRFGGDGGGELIAAGGRRRLLNLDQGGYGSEDRGRERVAVGSTKAQGSDGGSGSKQELMKVERKPAQAITINEDDGMTIGKFIRFMIIAAIVIALFMLLLGQFLQISKSME